MKIVRFRHKSSWIVLKCVVKHILLRRLKLNGVSIYQQISMQIIYYAMQEIITAV